jgi:hypothetical protein
VLSCSKAITPYTRPGLAEIDRAARHLDRDLESWAAESGGKLTYRAPGTTCQYTVECQSGTKDFTLRCSGDPGEFGQLVWVVISPFNCAETQYDSCPGTELYCPYTWTTGKPATNPPGVCPPALPPSGENCWSEFLGPMSPCGHPCDPETKSGWTVATCSYTPTDGGSTKTWTHDGARGP